MKIVTNIFTKSLSRCPDTLDSSETTTLIKLVSEVKPSGDSQVLGVLFPQLTIPGGSPSRP